MQEIVNHHRLKHVQFKVALAPTHGDGSVVAHHLTADHGHGFGLGWVDLAGHDGGARFVGWQSQFTQSTARA